MHRNQSIIVILVILVAAPLMHGASVSKWDRFYEMVQFYYNKILKQVATPKAEVEVTLLVRTLDRDELERLQLVIDKRMQELKGVKNVITRDELQQWYKAINRRSDAANSAIQGQGEANIVYIGTDAEINFEKDLITKSITRYPLGLKQYIKLIKEYEQRYEKGVLAPDAEDYYNSHIKFYFGLAHRLEEAITALR